MGTTILKAILLLALPCAVFLGGGTLMGKLSGREHMRRLLRETAEPCDRKPLNMRLTGYDADAVRRHWGALDALAIRGERRFLRLDLGFPLLYGGAFAASLLMAWAALGRPFHPGLLLAPVAVTLAADWTENLVQLRQLDRYAAGVGLQAGPIGIASTATVVKLLFFAGSGLLLLALVIRMVWLAAGPRS